MVHASVDVDQKDPESRLTRPERSLGICVSPVRYTFVIPPKFREKCEREATILRTKLPVGLKDDQIIIGEASLSSWVGVGEDSRSGAILSISAMLHSTDLQGKPSFLPCDSV